MARRMTRAEPEALGPSPEQRAEPDRQLGGGGTFDYGRDPVVEEALRRPFTNPATGRPMPPVDPPPVPRRDPKPENALVGGGQRKQRAGDMSKLEERFRDELEAARAR